MTSHQLLKDQMNAFMSEKLPCINHENGPYTSSCLLRVPQFLLPELFRDVPKIMSEFEEKCETSNRKAVPRPKPPKQEFRGYFAFIIKFIRDGLGFYTDEVSEYLKDEIQFSVPNQTLLDSTEYKIIPSEVDKNRLNKANSFEEEINAKMSQKYETGAKASEIGGDEELGDDTDIFETINDESACGCEICSQITSSDQIQNLKKPIIKRDNISPEGDNSESSSKGSIKDNTMSAHAESLQPEFNYFCMMSEFSDDDDRKESQKMVKRVQECQTNEAYTNSNENAGLKSVKDNITCKNRLESKVRFDENVVNISDSSEFPLTESEEEWSENDDSKAGPLVGTDKCVDSFNFDGIGEDNITSGEEEKTKKFDLKNSKKASEEFFESGNSHSPDGDPQAGGKISFQSLDLHDSDNIYRRILDKVQKLEKECSEMCGEDNSRKIDLPSKAIEEQDGASIYQDAECRETKFLSNRNSSLVFRRNSVANNPAWIKYYTFDSGETPAIVPPPRKRKRIKAKISAVLKKISNALKKLKTKNSSRFLPKRTRYSNKSRSL